MLRYFVLIALNFLIALSSHSQTRHSQTHDPDFVSFHIDSLEAELDDKTWMPFFKGQNLLSGIYRLTPGSEDRQEPHNTDEVYYVVKGKAKFIVENKTYEVNPGKILFVKAGVEHRFFEVEEELLVLVYFDR